MKLYHFPSPNPQKVTFALLELGLDCEKIPVDLAKREQRDPEFLAINPFGRVPVLVDEATVARGEKALTDPIGVVEGQLTKHRWMLGPDFSLVDCAYCPILNVIEKAGFSFAAFPRVTAYLEAARSRQAWKDTPKLPML
jgi:glutathione S-transferase